LFYGTPIPARRLKESRPTNSKKSQTALPYALSVQDGHVDLPPTSTLIWELSDTGKKYTTNVKLYRTENSTLVLDIDCEGKGRFSLSGNNMLIDWQLGTTEAAHYFQTLAMALFLEVKSTPCIHANAIVIDDKCIALIAPSGMGKTTLSAYLKQQGAIWLTDDMLALHCSEEKSKYYVYPSWPKARMWPDSLEALAQSTLDSRRVHERFAKLELNINATDAYKRYELSAIYVLSRDGANLAAFQQNQRLMPHKKANQAQRYLTETQGSLGLTRVSSSVALMALLQNSILGNAYANLGLEVSRLRQLSNVVNNIPVKQIHYANSFETLADVDRLIKADLFNNI
jgi:hypothetical protein